MSSKSKTPKKRPVSYTRLAKRTLSMFLWAYCEVHDPTPEQMEAMSRAISSVQEGVASGRLRVADIESALWEEHGWKVV
jgi:hypothetical protein